MRYLDDDEENSSEIDEEEVEEGLVDEEEDSEPENDDELEPVTPSRRKRKQDADDRDELLGSNIIVETAFDAYFKHQSTRSRTSANVFSSLVPPLTAEEYAEAIDSASKGPSLKPLQPTLLESSTLEGVFVRFMRELAEGFNLLMYGYGSKRRVLNQFAVSHCAKSGHVVVSNAFQPNFTFKDLLTSIERVPGILDTELSTSTPESQSKRIYDFFSSSGGPKPHLYLIIHNIDAAPLRHPKAKSCLALLALNPRIHIAASVDHIHAPLLFSLSESATRKPDPHDPPPTVPRRGFAWLWHDLTTLAPYDFELAHADRTSIQGAHGGGPRKKTDAAQGLGGAAGHAGNITETGALHVLASVTQKAKKLFLLIGARQLESIESGAAGDGAEGGEKDLQVFGIGYDLLFKIARDDFIATNDTALRALLGEFRDHRLVVSAQGTAGVGEVLWIPMRKERLAGVLESLRSEES
ncbi:hypothetical protein H0H92_014320 [Tricholoma furcatifolium]|nr:hypothetical protein H0H92_014320 [Tricholoma furcatifolium]